MESLRPVAEDRASAAFLAQFRAILMFDPGDGLQAELSKRGPLFRQEKKTVGPGSYVRPFDDDEVGPAIVRGVRSIRITICPGLDQRNASVRHLLEVAHVDGVEIAAEDPSDTENVFSLSVHVNHGARLGGGVEMRLKTRWQTIHAGGEGPQALPEWVATGDDRDVRLRAGVALLAHETAKRDLFVTDDEGLLAHRSAVDGIAATAGIVSPAEAVRLVYAVLRGRNQYLAQGNYRISEDMFFAALVEWSIPSVVSAFRHLLGGADEPRHRMAAETVESLIRRVESLLMAADEMGRLHLTESRQGGDAAAVARHLSLLRESITLYTGALDACALTLTQLADVEPSDLRSVGWWHLCNNKKLFAEMQGDTAVLRGAAQTVDRTWPNLVDALRQRHHHRDGLQCLVTRVQRGVLTYGTFTVLRLDGVDVPLPTSLPTIGDSPIVQPLDFQHALTRNLIEILERVFRAVAWADTRWYEARYDTDTINEVLTLEIPRSVAQWWWA